MASFSYNSFDVNSFDILSFFISAAPAVPSGGFVEGTLVSSSGVVQIVLVAATYTPVASDIYILGTLHRNDGTMYMTNDNDLNQSLPNVHINGVLHSHTGVRYNAGIGASEDKVSKGFITSEVNGAGRQITTTVVAGNIEHGILRSNRGEMVVEENL